MRKLYEVFIANKPALATQSVLQTHDQYEAFELNDRLQAIFQGSQEFYSILTESIDEPFSDEDYEANLADQTNDEDRDLIHD